MPLSRLSPQGSRLISRVLPVAVKLWLQTQLDDIGDLTFAIQATDRQVLSGHIPDISLATQQAIYQGVQITDVSVRASDIEINIGQVLRGKPLRLKQEFPIEGQVVLDTDALAASSTKSILADGLLEVWQTLLADPNVVVEIATHYGAAAIPKTETLFNYQSKLQPLGTDLVLHLRQNESSALCLRGHLTVEHGHVLRLTNARWCLASGVQVPSKALDQFCWDLGKHTEVRSLEVNDDGLTCHCRIRVQP